MILGSWTSNFWACAIKDLQFKAVILWLHVTTYVMRNSCNIPPWSNLCCTPIRANQVWGVGRKPWTSVPTLFQLPKSLFLAPLAPCMQDQGHWNDPRETWKFRMAPVLALTHLHYYSEILSNFSKEVLPFFLTKTFSSFVLGSTNYVTSCIAWSPCGAHNSGSKAHFWLFYWLLGPYFPHWVALPSLTTKGGA